MTMRVHIEDLHLTGKEVEKAFELLGRPKVP
jgi:hypothetical protein